MQHQHQQQQPQEEVPQAPQPVELASEEQLMPQALGQSQGEQTKQPAQDPWTQSPQKQQTSPAKEGASEEQKQSSKKQEQCTEIRAFAVMGGSDTELKEWTYKPRDMLPDDVEVRVIACGFCHTDYSQINQEWGDNSSQRPFVPGHEIVGEVTCVGPKAEGLHEGDRVAVGPNVGCCGDCEHCRCGEESYCAKHVDTYLGEHEQSGEKTQGGFAEHVVAPARFVFKVPDGLPTSTAAPLMCAGVTVFQPLKRHYFDGATVGIVGVGGLGHIAVQFARALGYKRVVAITHSKDKASAARDLGAHDTLCSADEDKCFGEHKGEFDVLLVTATADLPWDRYAELLRVGGVLCLVGLSPSGEVNFKVKPFIYHRLCFTGSLSGGTKDTQEMLETAAKHNVRACVELFPLDVKGVNEALKKVGDNDVHFRAVLVAPDDMERIKQEVDEQEQQQQQQQHTE